MDDNIDEEMIAVLLEPNYVENFAMCNTEVRIDSKVLMLIQMWAASTWS